MHLWQKIVILLAGPAANLLTAILVLTALYWTGISAWMPAVAVVETDSPAAEIGLESGDVFVEFDGRPVSSSRDLLLGLVDHLGSEGSLEVVVERGGVHRRLAGRLPENWNERQVPLANLLVELKGEPTQYSLSPWEAFGIRLQHDQLPPLIQAVQPDSPAARAGLQAGDRIECINDVPLTDWRQLQQVISALPGMSIELCLNRFQLNGAGQSFSGVSDANLGSKLAVDVAAVVDQGVSLGRIGIVAAPRENLSRWRIELRRSLPQAFTLGIVQTAHLSASTLRAVVKVVRGVLSVDNISGPVGIVSVTAQTLRSGVEATWFLVALLSVSLGVMNLLPIPLLDGGRITVHLYEAVIGRTVTDRTLMAVNAAGLFLIACVFVLTLHSDLQRLTGQ